WDATTVGRVSGIGNWRINPTLRACGAANNAMNTRVEPVRIPPESSSDPTRTSSVLPTPSSERTGRRGASRVLVVMLSTITSSLAAGGGGGTERIFNGRDLAGGQVSTTNHPGKTRAWGGEDGALVGGQEPEGGGGVLLTNRRYRDVEVALDVWPDFGCDS